MPGRAVVVVGPSGAGKDTLIAALCAARADLHAVRRVITRPETAGGEPFEGVDDAEFDRRVAAGAFALHWGAHGLRYGIPGAALAPMRAGGTVVMNLSRRVLPEAQRLFGDRLLVLALVAPPDILAARLAQRGREDAAAIAGRIARGGAQLPAGLAVATVDNGGTIDHALAQALAALDAHQPEARLTHER